MHRKVVNVAPGTVWGINWKLETEASTDVRRQVMSMGTSCGQRGRRDEIGTE